METLAAVKEHPMLFSDELVRAIEAGDKTQTRRPFRPQPFVEDDGSCTIWHGRHGHSNHGRTVVKDQSGTVLSDERYLTPVAEWLLEQSKIKPGDRIWVRETWHPGDGDPQKTCYRADDIHRSIDPWDVFHGSPNRWFPSIHMPRWACRTVLEVTDVRAEQIQSIAELDARDEGVQMEVFDQTIGCRNYQKPGEWFVEWDDYVGESCRRSFQSLWDSIYGKSWRLSWEDNPWVLAYTFHKV